MRIAKLEFCGRFQTYSTRSLSLCSGDPSEFLGVPWRTHHREKRELQSPGLLEHLFLYIMESICNIIFQHFHTQSKIAQAGLELAAQLRISLNFVSSHSYLQSAWDYEYAPLYLVSAVQGIEPRTPCMLGEHFMHQATCPAPLNRHLENSHAQIFESHSDFLQLSPPLFFDVVGNLSQGGGKLCPKPVVAEVGLELGSYMKSFFFLFK